MQPITESFEVNFDGIVGPTHNYSGLSYGNVASLTSQKQVSNPKEAALQGLEKMKYVADLGVKQAVLPPHERPHLATLKNLGFTGSDGEVLATAFEKAPTLLEACGSSAAMWTANAATVIPSADSIDQHVHFIPANLSAKFHRSIEAATTANLLKAIFPNPIFFTHHAPLPAGESFSDEGAANHVRLCKTHGGPGLHLFVFGRSSFQQNGMVPKNFPARQTLEASQALTRLSQIYPQRTFLAQQNPLAIDAGVFHNDVIAVGHRNVFVYHTQALLGMDEIVRSLQDNFALLCNQPLICIPISEKELSFEDAVQSYFFNSQILSTRENHMVFLAPQETLKNVATSKVIERILNDDANPINEMHYVDLQQSMRNGGGPACLRLRVPLTQKELQEMRPQVLLTDRLYNNLKAWIQKNYRDRLHPKDLADPQLLIEGRKALDELTKMLQLGSIYSFQR